MGKPKKGSKGRKDDDDWEDDVATEIAALSIGKDKEEFPPAEAPNGEVAEPTRAKTNRREKKKKKQKAESEEEEDIKDHSGKDDIEEVPVPAKRKGKAKAKGMSAFQMLAVDSDEQSSASSEPEEYVPKPVSKKDKKKQKKAVALSDDDDNELADQDPPSVPEPAKTKSKAKPKEKKKEEYKEDNIDALMAEIEGAASAKQQAGKGKKKKKGIEQANEDMGTENNVQNTEPGEGSSLQGLQAKDVSAMTQDEIAEWLDSNFDEEDTKKKRKKKKGKQEKQKVEEEDQEKGEADEDDAEGSTLKTAAQKRKEKKERQKQQKKLGKTMEPSMDDKGSEAGGEAAAASEANAATAEEHVETKDKEVEDAEEGDKKKKKTDKKKKGEKEEEKRKPSKQAKMILEQQRKMKEEQDRLLKEEQEKERIIEERIREKEEMERHIRERKDQERQRRKDKIEKLKSEGKYLSPKQREDKRRAEQMLESRIAQGMAVPLPGEPKKKVVYGDKKKKKRPDQDQKQVVESPVDEKDAEIKVVDLQKEAPEVKKEKEDDVMDSWEAWDAESEEETVEESKPKKAENDQESDEADDDDDDEDDDDSDEESEEESSEEESDEDESLTPRDKALARIARRKEEAEKDRSTDNLRAPVVCVLGHVDTGKTKILDKLRKTHVQDDEAGGITQQIGATNVPKDVIQKQTVMCKDFAKAEFNLPGLLIIDTPGHESFSNLRTRGSSLCDIAILVIDIMHALEPQTIESINLLRKKETPFIIALNKIDRLFQWQSNPHNDVVNTLKKQKMNTKQQFDERVQMVVLQLAEQGLNACLFHENKDPTEYISMVPTSAHTGDGMGNLVALICETSQRTLAEKLAYSKELQATVMEVKAIVGLGTTIDVILVNGCIDEGATMILAGQEGPIVTPIRALLMPEPMKELRVKNAYNKFKEIQAAQGCKIIAKDLEKALAGLPLYIANKPDEIEIYREEISEALEEVLGSIKVQERGVFVQASTLGSLEALLSFLKTSKIPYAGINIGPVHKKDIMRASVMLEHDQQLAVILAFDVKVEREAQEMADSLGVTIFTAEIIYHLFDKFMAHREKVKKQKQEEFKHVAVFPCKLKIIPQYIFNSRDPIVCGVIVDAGFIKVGTPLCVPSKEFVHIGYVTSLEINHKQVDKAVKGQEVCIKVESAPGDTPKMIGRHFDETDVIVSKISRASIDAVKNYFRDEMSKNDWQLTLELKKTFEIL